MSVTLALFSAASAAFMPLPNTQLPVSARSVVRMDGGGLSRFPKLPAPVTDVLKNVDLQDPSEMSLEDQDSVIAATAATTAAVFLLPIFEFGFFGDLIVSTLIGGGAAAFCSLRKDQIGDTARNVVGKGALTAFDKAKNLEKDYKVTETVKEKVDKLVGDIKKSL